MQLLQRDGCVSVSAPFNTPLEMRRGVCQLCRILETRRPFNTPLEMLAALNVLARHGLLYGFQYSIGDAAWFIGGWPHVIMQLSILHWRCARCTVSEELKAREFPFNTPLEMPTLT